MSRLAKGIITAVLLVCLVAAFAVGYYFGGLQAVKGFPEEIETWQKERGVRVDGGLSPNTLWFPDGSYRMYYTTSDGIASATSYNGLVWTKEEDVRIAPDPKSKTQVKVGAPCVFEVKGERYKMIYEGSDSKGTKRYLFSAASEDGVKWSKQKGHVIEDENSSGQPFASAPEVLRLSAKRLILYYSNGTELKAAESTDDAKSWNKVGLRGIDGTVIDVDVVTRGIGVYKMYYTVSASQTELKDLMIVSATSEDGLTWAKDRGVRVRRDEKAEMVFDPDIVRVSSGKYRMYYCQLDEGTIDRRRSYEKPPVISIRSAILELK